MAIGIQEELGCILYRRFGYHSILTTPSSAPSQSDYQSDEALGNQILLVSLEASSTQHCPLISVGHSLLYQTAFGWCLFRQCRWEDMKLHQSWRLDQLISKTQLFASFPMKYLWLLFGCNLQLLSDMFWLRMATDPKYSLNDDQEEYFHLVSPTAPQTP